MLVACAIVFEGWNTAFSTWILVSPAHAVIDGVKGSKIVDRFLRKSWGEIAAFCIDQALNLAFCAAAIVLLPLQDSLGTVSEADIGPAGGVTIAGVSALFLAVLASCRSAAVPMKVFLFSIEIRAQEVGRSEEKGADDAEGNDAKDESEEVKNEDADTLDREAVTH